MGRLRLLKVTVGTAVAIAFVGALLGIVITGPIVVPQPLLSLDVAPSAARLRADVERLCGEFGLRDAGNIDTLDRTADWIAAEFEAAGLQTRFQDYELPGGRYRNVIGTRPGTTDERQTVIVGAHYDVIKGSPGADDNASGIAALLELVRTLPSDSPRLGQQFVAFSTHEPPAFGTDAMGSDRFAAELAAQDAEVRLMIALDMVGYYSSAPDSQRAQLPLLGLLYPDRGDFLSVSSNLQNGLSIRRVKQGIQAMREMPVHSFRAPAWLDEMSGADHASFLRHGFPAVLVTDTGRYRNPHYHDAGDRPGTLDYDALSRVVLSLHGVLWNNGGAPPRATAPD